MSPFCLFFYSRLQVSELLGAQCPRGRQVWEEEGSAQRGLPPCRPWHLCSREGPREVEVNISDRRSFLKPVALSPVLGMTRGLTGSLFLTSRCTAPTGTRSPAQPLSTPCPSCGLGCLHGTVSTHLLVLMLSLPLGACESPAAALSLVTYL